jgi:hypothetical protein
LEGINGIKFKNKLGVTPLIKSVYEKDIPSGYCIITFTLFKSELKLQNAFTNKKPFSNKFWGFKSQGRILILVFTSLNPNYAIETILLKITN